MGNTLIQRGWSRSFANALTLSPGAAVGFCPSLQPWAVGILSVGMAPCGFASGIAGVLPQAGAGADPCERRHSSATGADQRDDARKNTRHVHEILQMIARTLSDVRMRWNLIVEVR